MTKDSKLCSGGCLTGMSFSRTTASDRCRPITAITRTFLQPAGDSSPLSTCRQNRIAVCSAATPIGADRSGSRSTICWCARYRSSIAITAIRSRWNVRSAPAKCSPWAKPLENLADRLINIFLRDPARGGRRAVWGANDYFQTDPNWRDYIPFHEYFNGDTGAGVGASHQTGWTSLVASLLMDVGQSARERA